MPQELSSGSAVCDFDSKVDASLSGPLVPFVDQLVSHTVHGLAEAAIRKVMEHKVSDKYVSLGGGREVKKISPGVQFVGPKRSKFRKLMSARQRKSNGFDELSAEHEKWEMYEPLHELWKQYMDGVLGSKSLSLGEKAQRFARSDWHGALLQVVKSCSPGLVGTQGIVIKETTNTFTIITNDNKFRTIPKPNNVFTAQVGKNTLATLYGNHIIIKSADRSARKYKSKLTIDIGV